MEACGKASHASIYIEGLEGVGVDCYAFRLIFG